MAVFHFAEGPLADLELFAHIARAFTSTGQNTTSFAKVAERLAVTDDAVHDCLKRLEKAGRPLFTRGLGRRPINRLTPAGRALLKIAQRLVSVGARWAAETQQPLELRVALPASLLSSDLFNPVIAEYRAPLELRTEDLGDLSGVIEKLLDGRLDLAVVWENLFDRQSGARIRHHGLRMTPIEPGFDVVLVAREETQLQRVMVDGEINFGKLAEESILTLIGDELTMWPKPQRRRSGARRVQQISSSIDVLLAFVRAGAGFGLLPAVYPTLDRLRAAGKLTFTKPLATRRLCALSRADSPYGEHVAKFEKLLIDYFPRGLNSSVFRNFDSRRPIPTNPARYIGKKWAYFTDSRGGIGWHEETMNFHRPGREQAQADVRLVRRLGRVTITNDSGGTYLADADVFDGGYLLMRAHRQGREPLSKDGFVAVLTSYQLISSETGAGPEFAWTGIWFGADSANLPAIHGMVLADRILTDSEVRDLGGRAVLRAFLDADIISRLPKS